jgi:hypothetical protein
MKGLNIQTLGLGIGAFLVMWGTFKFLSLGTPQGLDYVEDARKNRRRSVRYPDLEYGAAAALEGDMTLSDIVDRLEPYAKFDEEVYHSFTQAAAALSEFKLQCEDPEMQKRGRLQLFHEHMTAIQTQLRFLRRKIFESNPGSLEDYDTIAKEELGKYAKSEHHNLWCES